MPTPMSTPCVPPGFPPFVAAGGQTTRPSGPIAPETEDDGPTVSPVDQTPPCIEVGRLLHHLLH
jgi:hypothetical protein